MYREYRHLTGNKCPECEELNFPIRDIGRCGHRIFREKDLALERLRALSNIKPIVGADEYWGDFVDEVIKKENHKAE